MNIIGRYWSRRSITTPILCIIILLSTTQQISSSSWAQSNQILSSLGRGRLTKLGASIRNGSHVRSKNYIWGCTSKGQSICSTDRQLLVSLRGGAFLGDEEEESDLEEEEEYDVESEEEEEESDDEEEEESDDDEEEEEYSEEDEYDEEYDVESDEDEEESSLAKSVKVKVGGQSDDDDNAVFDDPLVPSPMQQMSMTIGIMIACRRVDLFDPKVVRIARFVFISYALTTQLFLAYVRIKARRINDRTPITLNNPLSSVVQSQLSKNDSSSGSGSGGTSDMVKNLAGQFLSSQTTILEYDLKQAKSMSNSLLFPLAFNWFLHFKMNQVQPLLFQTANGLSNLFYSPLFQVYVLGRNLERPFKSVNAMTEKMEALKKQQEEEAAAAKKAAEEEESVSVEEEKEENATEEEEEEQSDDEEYDEEESEEEDADDEDEEYDEDDYDEEGEES